MEQKTQAQLNKEASAFEKYIDYQQFYDDVCMRAITIMEKTGKVEGAHFAAMNQLMNTLRDLAGPDKKA